MFTSGLVLEFQQLHTSPRSRDRILGAWHLTRFYDGHCVLWSHDCNLSLSQTSSQRGKPDSLNDHGINGCKNWVWSHAHSQ